MKFSLILLAAMFSHSSFAAPMCTAEAGYLLSPSGECQFFTNGCEKNNLLALGFQYTDFESCDMNKPQAEEIMGLLVNQKGITFIVFSGGCTGKADFDLEINRKATPAELTLIRHTADFCEALIPYGVAIEYSWSEIGFSNGTEFTITNKFGNQYFFDFQPQGIL